MRKQLLFISIYILCSLVGNAQIAKRDSLLKLLPIAKEDTSKALLLLKIADEYETSNQDSSIYYLEESKKLSDRLGFQKGIYHYFEQSAIVSFTKGDYQLAMLQSNSAIKEARELRDSSLLVNMLVNTGIVYQYLGLFDKQLDYSLQALVIAEKNNWTKKLPSVYHNVANAYFNINQFRKSLDYCFLAIKLNKQTQSIGYINRVYASLGQGYKSLKLADSAIYYYKIAVKESVKLNDKYAEAAIYGYMNDAYEMLDNYKEMLKVSEASLSLSKELQSNQMLASSLSSLAFANYFNGNNAEARKLINEALVIAQKDTLKDELKYIYTVFSFIAARDGDFKTSVWANRQYDSIQATLLNEQVVKTTADLEAKYESEKKDKQIILQKAQLQKKEIFNYILIGSAIIILVISLLSYRNYKQKQKLQQHRIIELETQQQLTATEAVLKGEEQERTRLAKDLHDGLGGMLSGIKYSFNNMKGNLVMTPENAQAFERSMDMLDSSIKEMRRVAHNMMPEALVKFGLDTALKDFCQSINQSGALHVSYQSIGLEQAIIDQTTSITIYRIVQELINNTMKHAVAKHAIVQVSKTDHQLTVTVEDDGKGFDTIVLQGTGGIGWANIRHRVDFLKGKLDVNSAEGKGTSVLIELPIA